MQLFDLPLSPRPDGAVLENVGAKDGVRLRSARWPALSSPAKGTVCILQGRAEFIEEYYEVIRDLRARGFAVATFDWRGQGGSDRLIANPRLGHVHDFADYGRDLEAFMRAVILPECRPPFYALAHSMGAAILLYTMHGRAAWFERIVATAPMIDILRPFGADVLAILLKEMGLSQRLTPGRTQIPMALRPFAGNPLTSDPGRYEACAAYARENPDLNIGDPTIGWVACALSVTRSFREPKFGLEWRIPMLMVVPENDEIVSSPAAMAFAKKMRGTGAVMIRDCLHEVMQERDALREQFWAAFDAFIPGTGL